MKALHVIALAAALTGITAGCISEYPPVCYQQIYHLNGSRTDAAEQYSKGEPLPSAEYKTELQQLYALCPDAAKEIPNMEAYRMGWFFNQAKLVRTCGEGIADLCNHAAWFVLHCVKDRKQQNAYAKRIVKLMREFDEPGALTLLEELRASVIPGGIIQVVRKNYDEENQMEFKSCTEVFAGTLNGKRNPRFGLHRTYHENQMLADDVFYYAGTPIGYAFSYTDDGKLKAIYYHDGKGGITVCYAREKSDAK